VTGGHAAYSGRADGVVEYFAEAGHVAPALTNVPGIAKCFNVNSRSFCLDSILMPDGVFLSRLDFILDTASVNLRSPKLEEDTRKVVNALVDRFNNNKKRMLALQLPSHSLGELPKVNPQYAGFSKAFPILTRRSFVNSFRQKGLYFNKICQPLFVGIIMSIFFSPLGNGPSDVTSRLGLLQQTTPIAFAGMLNNVAMYPFEVSLSPFC
jgi:hypothetical protein